jgi:hypothetical protein
MSRPHSRGTAKARQSKPPADPSGNGFLANRSAIRPRNDPPKVVTDHGPEMQGKALSLTAENLMAEYVRRCAFVFACSNGMPIDWAGDKFLGAGSAGSGSDTMREDGRT